MDCDFVMEQFTENESKFNLNTHIAFLHLQKAFPRLERKSCFKT